MLVGTLAAWLIKLLTNLSHLVIFYLKKIGFVYFYAYLDGSNL